jgi:hypothetical protein
MVVAALAVGTFALAKKPVPTGCPTPQPGWFCPTYYAPVVCGPDDCWYSNQCFASLAGWSASDCTPVGPGPIPVPF